MNRLTDEQVEQAAKTLYEQFNEDYTVGGRLIPLFYVKAPDVTKERYQLAVRLLAPHLQYPIELPTQKDAEACTDTVLNTDGDNCAADGMAALTQFVARRNAALLPKPDPRREKIIAKLKLYPHIREAFDNNALIGLADDVLMSIDEGAK